MRKGFTMLRFLVLLALRTLAPSSCALYEAHHRVMDEAQRLPPVSDGPLWAGARLSDRIVIDKPGHYELRCTLVRSTRQYTCKEYRCP
jgi:hypothetical protein